MIGRAIDVIIPDDRREEMATELTRIGRGEKVRHHETVRVANRLQVVGKSNPRQTEHERCHA